MSDKKKSKSQLMWRSFDASSAFYPIDYKIQFIGDPVIYPMHWVETKAKSKPKKENKPMSDPTKPATKCRLFIFGGKGHLDNFIGELESAKRAGHKLFDTLLPVPNHLKDMAGRGFMAMVSVDAKRKEWMKKNWGVSQDVPLEFHRKDDNTLMFTFYLHDEYPAQLVETIAQDELQYFNFELWFENVPENYEGYITYVRGKRKHNIRRPCQYGSMDQRFHQHVMAPHNY